jgi:hypothetical protein
MKVSTKESNHPKLYDTSRMGKYTGYFILLGKQFRSNLKFTTIATEDRVAHNGIQYKVSSVTQIGPDIVEGSLVEL